MKSKILCFIMCILCVALMLPAVADNFSLLEDDRFQAVAFIGDMLEDAEDMHEISELEIEENGKNRRAKKTAQSRDFLSIVKEIVRFFACLILHFADLVFEVMPIMLFAGSFSLEKWETVQNEKRAEILLHL